MATHADAHANGSAEGARLEDDARRVRNWKRWGPYLAERQWATVREDYSAEGDAWGYFPHDHARSRAYRWGEDGLLGICDREGRLCFALALWNGRDPILKERLFGLGGPEGNHGEEVKECYFYLDSTPTHSYMKALYKYPQAEFPYARLVEENRRRGLGEPAFSLADAGVFDGDRYFDVLVEYAKAAPDDLSIRITVANRGREAAVLHLLPTLWLRNTWTWGRTGEAYWPKGRLAQTGEGTVLAEHVSLGRFRLTAEPLGSGSDGGGTVPPPLYFTENETNVARLFGGSNPTPWVKDAFHERVVGGRVDATNPAQVGTKACAHYVLEVPAGGDVRVRLRLAADPHPAGGAGGGPVTAPAAAAAPAAAPAPPVLPAPPPGAAGVDALFDTRIREADEHFARKTAPGLTADERSVVRQAEAGLLWTKQFYHYIVKDWLEGDPSQPAPPAGRERGRNRGWKHLYNRDVLSMPDKWEYPWFAAWDLAFHMIPFARVDPHFAKEQLVLFLREWYMHPNGQIPAYEFGFGDVNPPVHAWAAWRVYKMTGPRGRRDRVFLSRVFQKLLLTFTWWVNRKDTEGKNLFAGGFLGLDNIGVFDRSQPLPGGARLEQADATAWMAFFCSTMLSMALELGRENPAYGDLASKFFEHFVAIVDAMNSLGGNGLWDEKDGFYYDQIAIDGHTIPLKVRSLVGLLPLIAVEVLDDEAVQRQGAFARRAAWFLLNRPDLGRHVSMLTRAEGRAAGGKALLAIPSRERLVRVLGYMLDENEFLSPHGIRSVSRVHQEHPYVAWELGSECRVDYEPGESRTRIFGGNSNWRGPVWFPLNYLLVEALQRYHHFYGNDLQVECPTGSGRKMSLAQVACELSRRLASLFLPGADGHRPFAGKDARFAADPHWKDLVLFHEYFHGDTGQGLGAAHQTGWTALVTRFIEELGQVRSAEKRRVLDSSGFRLEDVR